MKWLSICLPTRLTNPDSHKEPTQELSLSFGESRDAPSQRPHVWLEVSTEPTKPRKCFLEKVWHRDNLLVHGECLQCSGSGLTSESGTYASLRARHREQQQEWGRTDAQRVANTAGFFFNLFGSLGLDLTHPFMVMNHIFSLPLPHLFGSIKRGLEAYRAT